jgi:hypothetical protein
MISVKKIKVAGFRGILAPLEVNFEKGEALQSIILYGANGTGKSSITDAWEWVTTGRIQHLAREGAEEGAYPHMAAKSGGTFVEVEFSDAVIGTVGLTFDHSRKTIPRARGNLSAARKLITHPCHIRYGDLTRFVLLRKAERFDALASLMGFVPQMEYQKALRRVQTQFEGEVSRVEGIQADAESRLRLHFVLSEAAEDLALGRIAEVCTDQGFPTAPTLEAAHVSKGKLAQLLRMIRRRRSWRTYKLSRRRSRRASFRRSWTRKSPDCVMLWGA